jgi:hypothetical protein
MWSDLGGRVIYKEKKHRYIYMIADKRTKKDMMSKLIWNVSEYPKGENVRYNTDYMPSIQTQLF